MACRKYFVNSSYNSETVILIHHSNSFEDLAIITLKQNLQSKFQQMNEKNKNKKTKESQVNS